MSKHSSVGFNYWNDYRRITRRISKSRLVSNTQTRTGPEHKTLKSPITVTYVIRLKIITSIRRIEFFLSGSPFYEIIISTFVVCRNRNEFVFILFHTATKLYRAGPVKYDTKTVSCFSAVTENRSKIDESNGPADSTKFK